MNELFQSILKQLNKPDEQSVMIKSEQLFYFLKFVGNTNKNTIYISSNFKPGYTLLKNY